MLDTEWRYVPRAIEEELEQSLVAHFGELHIIPVQGLTGAPAHFVPGGAAGHFGTIFASSTACVLHIS